MKTRDAFALKDFDEKKIFQRAPFKVFNLTDSNDEAVLAEISNFADLDAATMEARLTELKTIHERLLVYRQRIKAHRARLKRLFVEYKSGSAQAERAAHRLRNYNWFEEATELLALKFGKIFFDAEKAIDARRKKEFGTRLKQERQKAGLTQAELAKKLGSAPSTVANIEQGRVDAPTSTLIRLCKALNCSADKLLGFF